MRLGLLGEEHLDEPSVVIAIDEARGSLICVIAQSTLYELVNEYSRSRGQAIWVVFASVANFTPSNICECGTSVSFHTDNSARFVHVGKKYSHLTLNWGGTRAHSN